MMKYKGKINISLTLKQNKKQYFMQMLMMQYIVMKLGNYYYH